MADSDKSEPMDMDTAINHVAGLLGELEPDLSDNPEDKRQSEDSENQDQADESDEDDTDDEQNDDQDSDGDADVEDYDDADDDDQASDPWKVARKVTVDGKQIEVTPEEALLGYQRQQAFTRKTQEVSELKKTLGQQLEAVQTEQNKYVQALQVWEQAFAGALNEPNWDELRKDPAKYDRERVAFLERKEQLGQLQSARQQAEQQAQQVAKQASDSRLEEQRELLMMAIPEWVDSDVASKESAELVKYAMKQGFTTEDLSGIDDHRSYVVLRKAMLYDNAKGKPGKAAAKSGKPSPSLKPGSKPPRGRGAKPAKAQQKALSRLKKTGSMEDAIAAVSLMIDE